jgi:tetratricopeptide (TPR) repeat protein
MRSLGGRRGWTTGAAFIHDHGRALVAVLMSLFTFLGAVTATLQSDASTQAARGGRAADAASLERIGFEARSQVGTLRDNTAFREWFGLLEESAWAGGPQPSPAPADGAYRAALAAIDGTLAEWVRTQSALLHEPYFDPKTFVVDFNGYNADQRVAVRLATERAAAAATTADGWSRKASSYVTILTMLAVAVFFLGLAGTVAVRARGILIATGTVLGAASLVATVLLATGPVRTVPDAAVDAIVASQTAVERAGNGDAIYLTDATRALYRRAIADAATAVALDPLSVSAQRTSAEANLYFANARVFSDEGPGPETDQLLRTAVAAYDRAVALEPDDPSTWWNLGFARYLAGDAAGSIRATQEVIDRAPTQFVPYVNRAVALAAAGTAADADRSIEDAVRVAATSNLATNGFFFDRVDLDLARLADLRSSEAEWLRAAQRRLREARVAIRVRGSGDPDPTAPELATPALAGLALEDDGSFSELGPIVDGGAIDQARLVGLRLTLPGGADLVGRTLSIRAWAGPTANAGLAREIQGAADVQTLDLVDPYGRAGFPLAGGSWTVEVYVDGATRAELSFEVRRPG